MMKRLTIGLLVSLLIGLLVACGGSAAEPTAVPQAAATQETPPTAIVPMEEPTLPHPLLQAVKAQPKVAVKPRLRNRPPPNPLFWGQLCPGRPTALATASRYTAMPVWAIRSIR